MTPLQNAQEAVADYMDRIVKLFKPGVKITVVVRTPDFPERDFVMTDDAFCEVVATLNRRASVALGSRPLD